MLLTNIDIICRKWLLEKGLPIHFYPEALYHSSAAVMQLVQDTLQVINVANIPLDGTASANLPDDFDEDLHVCIPVGQALLPIPKQDWITPIRLHDTTTGAFVPYDTNSTDEDDNTVWSVPFGYDYFWNVDAYGSPTGRQFGSNAGTASGYKILREQRRIQLSEDFVDGNVVMLYISDGQRADNASQIDTKATKCIQTYIDWQRSPNATNERSPEARTFWNQKRRLKTLKNGLTKEDVVNLFRRSYTAAIKY